MSKRLFIVSIVLVVLFGAVGCSNNIVDYKKAEQEEQQSSKSVELFVKSKGYNFNIIKYEDDKTVELIDNTITDSFIDNQSLSVKWNGYNSVKRKWDQKNKLLLEDIYEYRQAMKTMGYDINIKVLRCNGDSSQKYFCAVNGDVKYDNLFEYIN